MEESGVIVEYHYVEGLVDVMLDAIHNSSEPLIKERMFGWHAALFPSGYSGMSKMTVANWRQGDEPMQVVSGALGHEKVHYEAPASSDIPTEMTRLIEWCNTANHSPFIMAAVAHLWFVTIHPFDDGKDALVAHLLICFSQRWIRIRHVL